jgi:lauroyl/myristoyl acyltransferase
VLLPDVRRKIIRNLRRVHGQRSVWREQLDALATLSNYASCFAEALGVGRESSVPDVRIRGEEHLQAALERGGVVLVTAHVGPWDFTAQLLRVL